MWRSSPRPRRSRLKAEASRTSPARCRLCATSAAVWPGMTSKAMAGASGSDEAALRLSLLPASSRLSRNPRRPPALPPDGACAPPGWVALAAGLTTSR